MKRIFSFCLIIIVTLLSLVAAFGQMQTQVLTYNGIEYIEYTPPEGIKPRAIIWFMHGLGEVGKGISAVERNEIPQLFKNGVVKEYIVIAPYLASGTSWPKNTILSLLDLMEIYKLKTGLDKVVVTGLSLGGIGTISTLEWAYYKFKRNDYFAAVGIVCGKSPKSYSDFTPFTGTQIKAWHGVNDGTLSISNIRNFTKAVNAAGGRMSLVEYSGVNHNAWDYAYRDGADEFWNFVDNVCPPPFDEPIHYDGVVYQEGEDIFFKSDAGIYKLQATKQ